ncbi:MAG TPA: NACHT domain-containing protein [Anaerolineae bacterium]|nr:NACHT domain-containing protein [Anaerolineae bacterium]
MTLPALRDLIDQHFSDEELSQLCLDLSVKYDNLPGNTHIAKSQALVEYCLRHDCLPELGERCEVLRPSINWPDVNTLAREWAEIQEKRRSLDNLTGVLPDSQLAEGKTTLRQKETGLLTQLIGKDWVQGDKVAGDKVRGDKIMAHIVHIYRAGGGRIPDEQLRQGIANYASWVMKTYGRIPLRGLSEEEDRLIEPDLPDVYISLAAQEEARGARRPETAEERQPVDMSSLLAQGQKLVITGAPGSGKTTFLRHIAYLLARAIHTGDETAARQQLNLRGPIPLPIYLSLGDYHRYKQERKSGTLIDFISRTLIRQHSVYNLPDDFFVQILSRENTVCLLLDSLDEIPDENGRFQVTTDVLRLANNDIGHILVASRDHAYVGRVMLPGDFHRFIVQPMQPEQVAALAARWCAAVYPPEQAPGETKRLQAEIVELEAIRRAQGDDPLVDTPLMVTIVAIVHYNHRKLPEQRAALYERCVSALLTERYKGEEGEGASQPELERRGGLSIDAKRDYLGRLAYEMMSAAAGEDAGRTAGLTQIREWLLPLFRQVAGAEAAPAQLETFRRAMCDRASILHERSGRHEFTHLTFQEFLCARHLAVNETPAAIAAFFRAEDRVLHSWWRETILLTIGYLGKTAVSQSLKLARELLTAFPANAAGLAAAELAASGLLELEAAAPDARQEARHRLVSLLADPDLSAPASLRALSGRVLSKLGDPRPGVGVNPKTGLPDIAWGEEVPAGTYTIGDGQKTWHIKQPYRLSRYPITNAQFQCFVDAPDGDDPAWWQGLPEEEKQLVEPNFPYANHPRVDVSWYQTVAFCRWLSDKLGQTINLPHEYEWEVAARWDEKKVDGRTYPWGGEFDPQMTNTQEGGIRQTTAVGIYPSGKNEALELYDLSGNVWEWCRNKYDTPDDDVMDDTDKRRALRGGSWDDDHSLARAAYRSEYKPSDLFYHLGYRVVMYCRMLPPTSS